MKTVTRRLRLSVPSWSWISCSTPSWSQWSHDFRNFAKIARRSSCFLCRCPTSHSGVRLCPSGPPCAPVPLQPCSSWRSSFLRWTCSACGGSISTRCTSSAGWPCGKWSPLWTHSDTSSYSPAVVVTASSSSTGPSVPFWQRVSSQYKPTLRPLRAHTVFPQAAQSPPLPSPPTPSRSPFPSSSWFTPQREYSSSSCARTRASRRRCTPSTAAPEVPVSWQSKWFAPQKMCSSYVSPSWCSLFRWWCLHCCATWLAVGERQNTSNSPLSGCSLAVLSLIVFCMQFLVII